MNMISTLPDEILEKIIVKPSINRLFNKIFNIHYKNIYLNNLIDNTVFIYRNCIGDNIKIYNTEFLFYDKTKFVIKIVCKFVRYLRKKIRNIFIYNKNSTGGWSDYYTNTLCRFIINMNDDTKRKIVSDYNYESIDEDVVYFDFDGFEDDDINKDVFNIISYHVEENFYIKSNSKNLSDEDINDQKNIQQNIKKLLKLK